MIGIDITKEMIKQAQANADKLKLNNVEFRYGDIEELPLIDNFADVVISNCVLNLCPNKKKAFSEIFRVLRPKGHFCISDVVIEGELPSSFRNAVEMYVGCVAGAIQKSQNLKLVEEVGFQNIQIKKEKEITIPDDIIIDYLGEGELEKFKKSNTKILSITLSAEKL